MLINKVEAVTQPTAVAPTFAEHVLNNFTLRLWLIIGICSGNTLAREAALGQRFVNGADERLPFAEQLRNVVVTLENANEEQVNAMILVNLFNALAITSLCLCTGSMNMTLFCNALNCIEIVCGNNLATTFLLLIAAYNFDKNLFMITVCSFLFAKKVFVERFH